MTAATLDLAKIAHHLRAIADLLEPGTPAVRITPELLMVVYGCSPTLAELYAGPLDRAMQRYDITTPARIAAFLAQIGHESGRLRHVREIWGPTPAQTRYEGRADLGNTQPGDGSRYRGRGLIQITGRANYAQVSQALGIDFVATPEALEAPGPAALSAAWFWHSRNLNALADAGQFEQITRRINGGLNGQPDRIALYTNAKQAINEGLTA